MLKKIILILSVLLMMFSSITAQEKVGTTGPSFLELSPSVKANGMGGTGVSLVHEESFYFNPGSLGLFALENKISISGFPKKNDLLGLDHYNSFISFPLQRYTEGSSSLVFAIGGYYSKLRYYMMETTYSYPEGTGRIFEISLKNYNPTFAVAYTGKVHIGLGVTYRYVDDDIFEYSLNGHSYDIGLIVRYPYLLDLTEGDKKYYLIPSFGISKSNLWGSVESGDGGYYFRELTRIGVSLEYGLSTKQENYQRKVFTITPVLEFYKLLGADFQSQYGAEISLFEFVNLRIGRSNELSSNEVNSKGFSINSRGLFYLLLSQNRTDNNFFHLLTNKLSLEYSYSDNSYDVTFHELIINIGLW